MIMVCMMPQRTMIDTVPVSRCVALPVRATCVHRIMHASQALHGLPYSCQCTDVQKSSFVPFPRQRPTTERNTHPLCQGQTGRGIKPTSTSSSVSTEKLSGWCDDALRIHTSSHCDHGAQQSTLTTHNEKQATSTTPYRVYTPNHQDMSFVHAGCRTIQY